MTVRVTDSGTPSLDDFEIVTITVTACPFRAGLPGWTTTESGGSDTGKGTVVADSCQAVMTEGDSFVVTLESVFVVPAAPTPLTFSFGNLQFDTSDPNFINDAFEVALVDLAGVSLVQTFTAGRDAFFNITEGQAAALGEGTSFNAADQTVTVDLTGVFAGTTARWIFRLVNNDSDTATTIRIVSAMLPDGTQPAGGFAVANHDSFSAGGRTGSVSLASVTGSGSAGNVFGPNVLGGRLPPTSADAGAQGDSSPLDASDAMLGPDVTAVLTHAILFASTNHSDVPDRDKVFRFDVTPGGIPTLQKTIADPSFSAVYGLAVSPSRELLVSPPSGFAGQCREGTGVWRSGGSHVVASPCGGVRHGAGREGRFVTGAFVPER